MPQTDQASARFQPYALRISLTVDDLAKSAAWYCDVLGFAEVNRMDRDGKLRAITILAGDVRIVLNQEDGARGWDRQKPEGFSLTMETRQDVDQLAAAIKAHGGTLDTEPADMPWGVRSFRFRDPDGYRFSISKPLAR